MRTAGSRDRSFTEYGAPSLHTSAGLFSALALVHELQSHGLVAAGGRGSAAYAYLAAVAWGAWIGLTRVYLVRLGLAIDSRLTHDSS